ncbi:minor capsid protein [uncultured Aeromicrobium sp.]|uniref:phage tail terminator protein n=1 Tax=uncultured Aeromicrobium sp. TaxID=337820 RepID=UPI0025E2C8EB|nr:minor capsid protein [uncultured Aeromicrobium sp.]
MRNRFLQGVALHLSMHGIGTYAEDGLYADGDLGIVLHARPQSPPDVISLSAYTVDDDPSLSDTTLGLQVWVRRDSQDPTVTSGTADAVFDLLHGAHDFRLPSPDDEPGVWVVQCLRRSQVSGGQDESDRWADIQNFYVTIHYPSAHRI